MASAKLIIRPMRRVGGKWQPCSFSNAQAYDLCRQSGQRLCRCQSLAEAKDKRQRFARILGLGRRSRDQLLGSRYSEVQEEVASRRGDPLYTSSKSPRNAEANERNK